MIAFLNVLEYDTYLFQCIMTIIFFFGRKIHLWPAL